MILIDGKLTSQKIREEIKIEAQKFSDAGEQISLAVIIVGSNSASQVYVKNKIKGCNEVGFNSYTYELPESTTESDLIDLITKLNQDNKVNGILLQLPLPKHLDVTKILPLIDDNKDVDGFSAYQMGKLALGENELVCCTPLGIIELLKRYNIEMSGKNAVVIGRSNIVGKPMTLLLLQQNATVTCCHSKTIDISFYTKNADIVVVAIGKANFLKKEMVKEGAVIIDVGMNRLEDGKLCGDVDFEDVKDIASYITPVPGGVGPMTITMLLQNTIKAFKMQRNHK